MSSLSEQQVRDFHELGYTVIHGAADPATTNTIRSVAEQQLAAHVRPLELEADVRYPGAPRHPSAPGGNTERRLLHAWQRDPVIQEWATSEFIGSTLRQLIGDHDIVINLNHHNCIMTKQPQFSSDTLWHRDTRYWHFQNHNLINAWLALGDEVAENGAMKVLPGSHLWDVDDRELDDAQFLTPDTDVNCARINTAKLVELRAGDLLLFSANIFHAANRNQSDETKYSLVFTYHGPDTRPEINTRSSDFAEISLP